MTDENSVIKNERIALRFKGREDFGEMCMVLQTQGISFSHAGFGTIILHTTQRRQIPEDIETKLDDLKKSGLLEEYIVKSSGGKRRRLPTTEETEEKLKEFIAKLHRS